MEMLLSGDPMTLNYWLNWRVLLCAIWVFGSMIIGLYLLWKYEHPDDSASNSEGTQQGSFLRLHYEESWKPCLRGIHPLYLMFFRIIAFCVLMVAISFDVAIHGFELFYYYTQVEGIYRIDVVFSNLRHLFRRCFDAPVPNFLVEVLCYDRSLLTPISNHLLFYRWTFTLVTIYFGLGSLISMNGCFHLLKMSSSSEGHLVKDMEQGLFVPLAYEVNGNGVKLSRKSEKYRNFHVLLTSGFWGYALQILFQITAGAVTISDVIYWSVIFPFLSIKDYEMNFMTVVAHSLNGIMLLGDTALNSLQFPWFRIAYFLLFTGIYVIFQWIIHASVRIW